MFDLLHNDKYIIHIIFRVFFQCLFPFTYKLLEDNFLLLCECTPASSRYQYASFCVEHRFGINAYKG